VPPRPSAPFLDESSPPSYERAPSGGYQASARPSTRSSDATRASSGRPSAALELGNAEALIAVEDRAAQDQEDAALARRLHHEEEQAERLAYVARSQAYVAPTPGSQRYVAPSCGSIVMDRAGERYIVLGAHGDDLILEGDPRPRRTVWLCYVIVLVNIGVLVAEFWRGDWQVQALEVNPMVGPSAVVLTEMGAKVTHLIQEGEWWRLFTAMFLHAGIVHLLANTVAVFSIGKSLEQDFGWCRVGLLYLLSGVFGNLLSANFLPLQVTVGASGACFGLLGAAWGELIQNQHLVESFCCEITKITIATAISLGLGLMPYIDNFAHIGGLVSGLLLGLVLLVDKSRELPCCCEVFRTLVQICAMVAFVAMAVTLAVLLFTSVDAAGWCTFCQHLNCIETPWWDCDGGSLLHCTGTQYNNGTVVINCVDGQSCTVTGKGITQQQCANCCT